MKRVTFNTANAYNEMMMLLSAAAPQASLHTYKDEANGSAKGGAEAEVYHDYPDSVMARRTLLTNIDKSVNVIQVRNLDITR